MDKGEYIKRLGQLKDGRSSWIDHWRDLGENVRPRSFRYLYTDRNRGHKRNQNIINNTSTRALRVMTAGMMAGITSPARQWFKLGTHIPGLSEYGPVRSWLDIAEDTLRKAFAGSNVYNGLHKTYEGLGLFGTSTMHIEEDAKDILRAYNFPIGQYCLANSDRLQVDSVYREFSMSARQLVARFGKEKCSPRVQAMVEGRQGDMWVEVLHVIEPADDYRPGSLKKKPWSSIWMENPGDATTGFLREEGFYEFPVMAPRWDVTGEDVYGESPGMEALGDIRALQVLEKAKGKVVQKIVDPPMQAPTSLMNQRTSILAGDVTYVDAIGPNQAFKPAMEINPAAVTVVEGSCREHEQRINATFYADLWLMLAERGSEDPQMTAREVAERHEEKMLQLGPVMERLERELLSPLIDRAFGISMRAGLLPPPPKELHGRSLSIEYMSIMALAQKMMGIASIERLMGFIGNIAAAKPEALDKIDTDEAIDQYADMVGAKSTLIVPDDQVQQIRAQRAKVQQQQLQAQQQMAAVQGAQTLSQTDTSGDNALTRLLPAIAGGSQ